MVKAKEIRELTQEEVVKKLSDLQEELYKYRAQKVTGQMEKTNKIRQIRRDIARIYTVINEKRG